VIDAYSRRVIGWALAKSLEAELTSLAALRMALRTRRGRLAAGLIHHSDRGVHYACTAYCHLLETHGIAISMSRRGNPYDNAKAESFMKTLKYEQVNLEEYQNIEQARKSIGHFIEQVYNRKRLHSSLGYVPPIEFEQHLTP
jgi:transposase InsO family protein